MQETLFHVKRLRAIVALVHPCIVLHVCFVTVIIVKTFLACVIIETVVPGMALHVSLEVAFLGICLVTFEVCQPTIILWFSLLVRPFVNNLLSEIYTATTYCT